MSKIHGNGQNDVREEIEGILQPTSAFDDANASETECKQTSFCYSLIISVNFVFSIRI